MTWKTRRRAAPLVLAALLPVAAAAQHVPGTPDAGFGINGMVATVFPHATSALALGVAVDAEGRIVVVGYGAEAPGDLDFVVVRYLSGGALDPGFGGDGIVTTSIGPDTHDYATAVAIRPDGTILVAGRAVDPEAPPPLRPGIALVRYRPDGALDTTFGNGGIVVTVLAHEAGGDAMAVQADGKIVVAGDGDSAATGRDPCVVRYHPDGSLDPTFGVGGVVELALAGHQRVTGVGLTSTGRILLSAASADGTLLIRLRPDGEPDETFGSFGFVTTPNGPEEGLVLQPDGKIVVPGSAVVGVEALTVARYNRTGSLDLDFAGTGVTNAGFAGKGYDAAVQPNGRIVVAGTRGSAGYVRSVLWRVDPGGITDPTFYTAPDSPLPSNYGYTAVTLQPDGKIVAAGGHGLNPVFLVGRHHGDPPDRIFGDGFESNDLTAWSASQADSGDLATSSAAAVAPTAYGLRAAVDDTTGLYVQDDSPEDEPRYRARFYVDPGDFDPGEAQQHRRTRTFLAFQESPTRRVAAIVLRRLGGVYAVMGRARLDDGSQADTPFHVLTGQPQWIELDLTRSSGPDASDGTFELWVDGQSVAALSGLDNDLAEVDFVRLGALSVKTGAAGTLSWDEFESRRQTYIGPLVESLAPPTPPAGPVRAGRDR